MRGLLGLILIGLLGGCGFTSPDPGHAVVFSRFGDVEAKCYPATFYFYNPFTTSTWHLDLRTQALPVKTGAASSDLQDVHLQIVVNYTLDGTKCHELVREVGPDYNKIVIVPAVEEVAKAASARFPVEKIIKERPALKSAIEHGLAERLKPYHIAVQQVSLTNIEFSPEFSKAIERKQIEEQNVQRKEYERLQAVKEAERAVALAKGQAEANELLQKSLRSSPEVLQLKALEKWDGVLPHVLGSGAIPFINVDGKKKATE